jgi:FMN-dependent oxidoreductase (nitrilotriacetate monooxygenase family)
LGYEGWSQLLEFYIVMTASSAKIDRKMKLSLFLTGDGNYHMAGWRLPGSTSDGGQNIQRWVEAAQTIERGKLDMLFIADAASPPGTDDLETQSLTARIDRMDPIPILSAVSMVTKNLGLAATMSTSYLEPYNLARTVASLDHISGGRAAWNIVTGSNKDDALQFNRESHAPHAERYERAEEFVDVVRGIWDSYDDDAFTRDKESGRYLVPEKVHFLNHQGNYFKVRGPSAVPRSPQGHPVMVQAGSSEPGMNISARVADVIFTSQSTLQNAKAFYDNVKGRCERFGRTPDDVLVMPGALLFMAETESEAKEKYDKLNSLIPLRVALQRLSANLGGVDLSKFDLDAPVPDIPVNDARVSAVESYLNIARREGLTLRQMAMRSAAAKHHWTLIGSVKQIADELEAWFHGGGADGFNILPSDVPDAINILVDKLVPELQRRGLFRTEYEGRTLRENLGLKRPADLSHRAK